MKKIQFNELITTIKENNQDFEFYPTTREIIEVISKDINKNDDTSPKILDIGAGNGNFFKILSDLNPKKKDKYGNKIYTLDPVKYAIEKSEILMNQMEADIFIIGTDFHEQTLIDKNVDIIFCNPPYSEYLQWVEKILTESKARYVYLVIPERWKNQKSLLDLIKRRSIKYKTLNSFDFLDAQRQARAKVDVIRFEYETFSYHNSSLKSDPFDLWFHNHFKINADHGEGYRSDYETNKSKKEQIKENLIKGQNLIERLEELYRADFDKLLNNYKLIEQLDYQIFKELEVNIKGIREALKLKIEGLKNLYWHELFENLDKITERLTKKSRKKLLDQLTGHTSIDFTVQNAYAVVLWVLKNANVYMDEQLKEVYLDMTRTENVTNYKSNKVMINDNWRYARKEGSHYKLEYRLVLHGYNNFCSDSSASWRYDYRNGLNTETQDKINDIITIARNLGFFVNETSFYFEWEPGKKNIFSCDKGQFAEIRAYKNGNIHCKFNQEFMKKLNIEAGRLNGWIKSPEEAAEEMNIPKKDVIKYFKTNFQLPIQNLKLIA